LAVFFLLSIVAGNLQHHWLFDGNLTDVINNVSFNSDVTPSYVGAVCNQGLQLNGTCVDTNSNALKVTFGGDFTVAFWLYLQYNASYQFLSLINQRTECTPAVGFWSIRYDVGAQGIFSEIDLSSTQETGMVAAATFNVSFSHVVFARSGDLVSLWTNGILQANASIGYSPITTNPLQIVCDPCENGNTNFYPNSLLIDELVIYDSYEDPVALYNSYTGTCLPVLPTIVPTAAVPTRVPSPTPSGSPIVPTTVAPTLAPTQAPSPTTSVSPTIVPTIAVIIIIIITLFLF